MLPLCLNATVARLLFSTENDLVLLISATIISYLFTLDGSYSCLNIYLKICLKEQQGLYSAFVVEFADTKYLTKKLVPPNMRTLSVYTGQHEQAMP